MTDYEIKSNISSTLIRLRKSHGMNQTQAGAIVGVPKTTYATWEQGKSMPDAETLYRIAEYYKVSMDEIYGIVRVEQQVFDSKELADRLQTIVNAINPDTYGVKKVVVDVKERKKKA